MTRIFMGVKCFHSTDRCVFYIPGKAFILAFFCFLALGISPAIYGQAAGSFSGNVTDKSGSGVAGATVTVSIPTTRGIY